MGTGYNEGDTPPELPPLDLPSDTAEETDRSWKFPPDAEPNGGSSTLKDTE